MKCLVGINSLLIPNKLKTGLLKCGPTESTNPNLILNPKTYFLNPKSHKILLNPKIVHQVLNPKSHKILLNPNLLTIISNF